MSAPPVEKLAVHVVCAWAGSTMLFTTGVYQRAIEENPVIFRSFLRVLEILLFFKLVDRTALVSSGRLILSHVKSKYNHNAYRIALMK